MTKQSESRVVEFINLQAGKVSLKIAPKLGGSIHQLTFGGSDILRPTPIDSTDVLQSACYPMVPIVNRIPNGTFAFDGRAVELAGNFIGTPDFIHGHGWQSVWSVREQGDDKVTLDYLYEGADWPWSYRASQEFKLLDDGLYVRLTVQNLSDTLMPATLGFHPFFPKTDKTRLTATYKGYWENNDHCHVTERREGFYRKDFTVGSDLVDECTLDHSHYGWHGAAVITEEGRPTIEITSSECVNTLHIYCPKGGDFVAVEPTLGRSDPFGVEPKEYCVLEPEGCFSIWMRLRIF